MAMQIENIPAVKWLGVTAGVIVLGYFLFIAAFGAVNGVYVAAPVARTMNFEELLTSDQRNAYARGELKAKDIARTKEFQERMVPLLKAQMKKVKWVAVFPLMSVFVFAILGFVAGLFRTWKYVAVIPAALFFMTVRFLGSDLFTEIEERGLIAASTLVSQLVAVYAFAYVGRRLRSDPAQGSGE